MIFFCWLCGEATKVTGYVISFLVFLLLKKLGCVKNSELLLLFKIPFSILLFFCGNWFCLIIQSVYLSVLSNVPIGHFKWRVGVAEQTIWEYWETCWMNRLGWLKRIPLLKVSWGVFSLCTACLKAVGWKFSTCWLCILEPACAVSVLVWFTEDMVGRKSWNYLNRKVKDKGHESIKKFW